MQRCSLRSLYLRASCTWHFKLRGLRDKLSRAANQGNTFPPHTSLRGFFCYFHQCATCRLLNPTRFALETTESCLTKRNSAPAGSRENRTAFLERRARVRACIGTTRYSKFYGHERPRETAAKANRTNRNEKKQKSGENIEKR